MNTSEGTFRRYSDYLLKISIGFAYLLLAAVVVFFNIVFFQLTQEYAWIAKVMILAVDGFLVATVIGFLLEYLADRRRDGKD